MTVPDPVVSAIKSLPISSVADLIAPETYHRMQWADGSVVVTSWPTTVDRAVTDAETRVSLDICPTLTIEESVWFNKPSERSSLFAGMFRIGQSRYLSPIRPDRTRVKAWIDDIPDGSGQQYIPDDKTLGEINSSEDPRPAYFNLFIDARWRRYYKGARIMVVSPDLSQVYITKMVSVIPLDGSVLSIVSLEDPPPFSPNHSICYPLIEAQPFLSPSVSLMHRGAGIYRFTSVESSGAHKISPIRRPGLTTGLTTHLGYPILEIPTDQASAWQTEPSLSFERSGSFVQSGIAEVPSLEGTRPALVHRFGVTTVAREPLWHIKEMFDYGSGNAYPFWFVDQHDELELVSFGEDQITFKAKGHVLDWSFRPSIAVIGRQAATEIIEVESVNRVGNTDVVTLGSSFTNTSDIRRVATARLSRFGESSLTEQWETFDVCSVDLVIREVLSERSVNITNLDVSIIDVFWSGFDPYVCGA